MARGTPWLRGLNRQDFEAILIAYHPHVEFRPAREIVDSGIADPSYRGHTGYVAFVSEWFGAWGAFRFEPHTMIDLGHRAVVLGTLTGRGGKSGAPADQSLGIVFDTKDAKVIRERQYFDHAEALEAVGLSE